jgi:pyruvate dehydrogenase E2 component (dihydrolipoamide acetyltransferase)
MAEFRMPSLGADMEAGTLVAWKVKPGDAVRRGDVVAVVETDKGAIEVEIWEDGVVGEIHVEEGARVPVGTVLATVRSPGAAPAAPPPERPARPPPATAPGPPPGAPPPGAAASPAAPPSAAPGERVRASPAARSRARELGVDLGAVRGTGPGGAVTVSDVEGAGRRPGPSIRHAIAAAMARSKREIPHYYLGTEVDLSRAMAWLGAENARRGVAERLLPVVLLLKAVACAAREVPEVNGFYAEGAFRPAEAVHLGVAISLRRGGLVAPALHDVDRKPLGDLMRELDDLVGRARSGGLRSSELADATLTVTSLGDLGVAAVYGVIYPPQVALVGLGRILERPWAAGGRIEARPVVTATLSGDHRVSDGIRGAQFLAALDRRLQAPEAL